MNQNSKLSKGLLMAVQSGANALSGANVVTQDFTGGWDDPQQSGWSLSGGKLWGQSVINGAACGETFLTSPINKTYAVTYRITEYISGDCAISLGAYDVGTHRTSNGNYQEIIKVLNGSATNNVYFFGWNSFSGKIDNVVIREINASALTLPDPSYTLSNSGAIPTYGHKGNNSYFEFDGVNDYMSLGDEDKYSFGNGTTDSPFSLQITINARSTTSDQIVVGKYISESNREYDIYLGSNIIQFTLYDCVNGGSIGRTCPFTYTSIKKVIVTYDGSSTKAGINIYIDGDLSDNADVGSGTYIAMSNTTSELILGSRNKTSLFYSGGISTFIPFNYALSADDVTYYSDPANHPYLVDQTATGVELVTNGDFSSDVSGWSALANTTITHEAGAIGGVSNTAKMVYTGSGNHVMYQAENLTIGKSYNYSIKVYGAISSLLLRAYDGSWTSDLIATLTLASADTWTTFSGKWTATQTSEKFGIQNDAITGTWYIDDISIKEAGATLILSPEGMLNGIWRDYYHDIDVAVGTGSTSPRLVKEFAGLDGWRFNGSTSYLSKTGASNGLTGDITISGWVYPISWGEGGYGRVFDNGEIIIYARINSTGLAFLRDGSTGALYSPTISLNTWTHFVYTSDATGYSMVYINGTLVASGSQGTPVSSTSYYFGNTSDGSLTFDGIISNFRIYNRILSAEEIQLSYLVGND